MDSRPDELNADAEPPPRWRGWLVRAASLAWFVVCAAALYGLHSEWSKLSLADLNDALSRIGLRHLALAAAFTAASYLCNALLGIFALRWMEKPIARPLRELAVSYVSSAFTLSAGGTLLGGGSVRMRFASASGIGAADVARIAMFTGVAGWAGHALASALLLIFAPPPLPWLSPRLARDAGVVLLLACAALPLGSLVSRRSWPRPGLLALTMVIATTDWLFAGLAMWALLPGESALGVWSFVAVVILSQAVAAFTHVPGGVGILEVTITKALAGTVPAPALAGALLAYRLVYYVVPFLLAIGVALVEAKLLGIRRETLRRSRRAALRGWNAIAPRLAALLALGGGFVLLLSVGTPMEDSRREIVESVLPLPFVEASHFVSSLAGAMLIVLARGLQRRIGAAWWLTVALMSAGIVFSLAKGFDWEESLVLAFMLACLLPTREFFHRHARLWTYRFTGAWWGMIAGLAAASLWLGYFTVREVPYQHELWWQFAFTSDAARSLRAAVGAFSVFAIIAVTQGLRPARRSPAAPVDRETIERLVSESPRSDAALALLGDKDFTVSEDGRSALMHADQGSSRIVMGDPLGDSDAADDLLWRFVENASDEGMRPVFYQVSAAEVPRLVDMGFKLFKLGEEACVDLAAFTLEGSAVKRLRQARSHFQRQGLRFVLWAPDVVAARIEELRAISRAWLDEHRAGEKGFSLGSFDDGYVKRFACAVVETGDGRTVAFANVWATGGKEELSVDLMRSLPSAPAGAMEGLFIDLMLWGKERGFRTFNLGMAPLSGLSTHPLAPLWHRLAARLFRRGEAFYNFQGLRAFKEKFSPEWEPRYIAVPVAWGLAAALIDATALIGGGLASTIAKKRTHAD